MEGIRVITEGASSMFTEKGIYGQVCLRPDMLKAWQILLENVEPGENLVVQATEFGSKGALELCVLKANGGKLFSLYVAADKWCLLGSADPARVDFVPLGKARG